MAKKKKLALARPGERVLTSPWGVMYLQDIGGWQHVLARVQTVLGEGVTPRVAGVDVIRTDGVAVRYERRLGPEARYLHPTSVKTPPARFMAYLRERLRQFGGSSELYDMLQVERPAIAPAEVSPDKLAAHIELYERAATLLGTTVEELRKKYGHLNPGLQAMNLRNRLRGAGHNV
jgi:hypothetical protein